MKKIDFKDLVAKSEMMFPENWTIARAAHRSQYLGLDVIDFDDVLHIEDVDVVDEVFRSEGVEEFTVTSTWSGIINFLAGMLNKGWKIEGAVNVETGRKWNDEPEFSPAVKFVR